MPTPRTGPATIARLRTHLGQLGGHRPADSDLLDHFVRGNDQGAFAELIRRHGPTVLNVCRRFARDRDDADDAFQATFLVLARKAGSIRSGSTLGAWLYGVALRAALAARARSHRRRRRETPVANLPDVPTPIENTPDPDTARAVLEEVGRLSDAYRAAVVLCELEGRPRATAARELGIPEGTLSSRLAAARKILAARLRQRGLAPAAALTALGASHSQALAADACRLASAFPSSCSMVAAELTEEIMRSTVRSMWRLWPAAVVLAIAVGVAVAGNPNSPAPPAASPGPDAGGIVVCDGTHLRFLAEDGTERRREAMKPEEALSIIAGFMSPGGRWLIVDRKPKAGEPARGGGFIIRAADGSAPDREFRFDHSTHTCWSPNEQEAFGTEVLSGWGWQRAENRHWRLDLATGAKQPLTLPPHHYILGRTSDRGRFLTIAFEGRRWNHSFRLCLVSQDGKDVEYLTGEAPPGDGVGGYVSRDGRKVLIRQLSKDRSGPQVRLSILDLTTRELTQVPLPSGWPADDPFSRVVWSPDGTRVALGSFERQFRGNEFRAISRVAVFDLRDRTSRVVFNHTATSDNFVVVTPVDWR